MRVDGSLPNVRCMKAGCSNFASVTIDLAGFKGSIALCNECFNNLYNEMKKYVNQQKQSGVDSSENNNKKRK